MYVCSLCNQSFSTQGSMKRHQETIHRQSGGFSCQVCSKRFYRKDHLGKHMKMHQLTVLLGNSVVCLTDVTVDLPSPPPLPPPLLATPPSALINSAAAVTSATATAAAFSSSQEARRDAHVRRLRQDVC